MTATSGIEQNDTVQESGADPEIQEATSGLTIDDGGLYSPINHD